MKKIIKGTIILLTLIVLVSCSAKGDYKFINLSTEYKIKNSSVDLYFKDDSDIAYIDVEKFIKLLDGVYYSKEFEFLKDYDNEILTINIEAEYDDEIISETLIMDVVNNEIVVSSLDFFSIYIRQTETDFSEGLISLDPIITEGNSITYELNKYDFDIILLKNNFYIPLFLINLLFNQDTYFDVYFNGETLYGIDTSNLSEKNMREISKTKYNKIEASNEIIKYSYNYAEFIIDYFYGLKDERNILSSKDLISIEDFDNGDLNKNIFNLTKMFDDLHTSHIMKGYYNNDLKEFNYDDNSNLGFYTNRFYRNLNDIQEQAIKYFGVRGQFIDIPKQEIINENTLVIYLTEFDVNTPKEVEKILKETDEKQIKNIIMDLTLNTGGNLGAVLRILTLMNSDEVWYHMKNKLDKSTMSYGVVGELDSYDEFNYYIKTSGITFSAANLMASIGKELGIKIIGKKTSGGASPISFHIFPNGSIINMSSNNVLSNKDYESIEYGIEPDHIMDSLYSLKEIEKIINN